FIFCFFIIFQILASPFNSELSAPQQLINQIKLFYIYRTEKTIALTVFPWLQNIKYTFPIAYQRLALLEHGRYLPHTVILLREQHLILRYFYHACCNTVLFSRFTPSRIFPHLARLFEFRLSFGT